MEKPFADLVIVIKGAGEMSSGVATRLFHANLRRIVMLETPTPLAIRRFVSFSEAVHEKTMRVEGIEAVKVSDKREILDAWEAGKIPVRVDPHWESIGELEPEVVIDAILAKRNLGTSLWEASLVIALGPGFSAGKDCHVIVETNPGHNLGRLIYQGRAEKATGIPGDIGGFTRERILRSPSHGLFISEKRIGDPVRSGEPIGRVGGEQVFAPIDGVLRGLIRSGFPVKPGLKIGDIDPRGTGEYCHTISDSARALGGSVLEAILAHRLCSRSGKNCAPKEFISINQRLAISAA
ncbi:MAG: selenium-dependent molybdenum cofactor biosynthesis protein YqeB [Syntrophobacteraceae bacterium]|nr:selenium-dependent molybdenum cofactor biosynthesis protein YqeB [Syntrophobacteraceae bacterium]